MKIISASRRTDIPAHYSDWFIKRIEAGFVRWRNPFGGRQLETPLRVQDVSAIVFWSRNYAPLLPHLSRLYEQGYRFLFHFTITGLPRVFEPGAPPAPEMVDVARGLADRFGPETVLWRYDPILVSSASSLSCHRRRFEELASQLQGATSRCYFSFPTFYGKVIRSTRRLERDTGIRCIDPPVEDKIAFAGELADIAESHGIAMFSCCSDALVSGKVRKARCVDAELLSRLYPDRMDRVRIKGTRRECGCYESADIGAYDTCPHGCVYCYANANKETAVRRWEEHDPEAAQL